LRCRNSTLSSWLRLPPPTPPNRDAATETANPMKIMAQNEQPDWHHPEAKDRKEPKKSAQNHQRTHQDPQQSVLWQAPTFSSNSQFWHDALVSIDDR
jgi:hypothetical protein